MFESLGILTRLRMIYAGFAMLAGLVSVNVWVDPSSATDWVWFYRVALAAAVGVFAYSVWRPSIGHTAKLFLPLTITATVRIADFLQDWFFTPNPAGETLDLFRRVTLGAIGWAFIVFLVLLIDTIEDRIHNRINIEACDNAEWCKNRIAPSNEF